MSSRSIPNSVDEAKVFAKLISVPSNFYMVGLGETKTIFNDGLIVV